MIQFSETLGAPPPFDATLTGTAGDDRLDGGDGRDLIHGLGGDDVIQGFGGADRLVGGSGDDVLSGGSGDDTLDGGGGIDSMTGGSGDDLVFVDRVTRDGHYPSNFTDVIDGGSGFDTVSFVQAQRGVFFDLPGGQGGPPLLVTNFEAIILTSFDDMLFGGIDRARLYDGGGGDDNLDSQHGHDTLIGGDGDDQLYGRDHGLFQGGEGQDTISGGYQSTLDGGAGDDLLSTFAGLGETLTGGDGGDTFRLSDFGTKADEITDLEAADVIDLSFIDADTHTTGDQAFVLVSHLSGHAGQAMLSYDAAADQTRLLLDQDGDGHADIAVVLDGDQTGFTNFVL